MPYRLYGNKLPYWWELLEFKAGSGAGADQARYLVHAMGRALPIELRPRKGLRLPARPRVGIKITARTSVRRFGLATLI